MRLSALDRQAIAKTIKADIDRYCAERFREANPRRHIGASEMGAPCDRRLVYSFRWMFHEEFDGRMRRLFDRGNKEEERFTEWLRGIGAKVATHDALTGKQIKIGNDTEGHYGGSLDGIVELPERYMLPFPVLAEMKTHSQNSFKKLVKDGVRSAKPLHFDQMCQYGEHRNMHYAIYIATNKNDDDIHVEFVELDFDRGKFLAERASKVVAAKSLPPRVAQSPAYDVCKWCPAVGLCHLGHPAKLNCRSCRFASPVEKGRWHCGVWKRLIPDDKIPEGCKSWAEFE
jgi:hypothetical protein